MAAPVPTTIPARFVAGDTLLFDVTTLSDYPPATWTLSFNFVGVGIPYAPVTFTATTNGGYFRVSVLATETELWPAGEYSGQAYVTSGAERHQVWTGKLFIDPNYALNQQIDTRTRARKILDLIDASFEKLAAKQTVRATIEGVDLFFRNLDELTKARNYWGNIVAAENNKAAGKQRGVILSRFTKPC